MVEYCDIRAGSGNNKSVNQLLNPNGLAANVRLAVFIKNNLFAVQIS